MKINNHARNGVRVSQYSKFILLGALAFLCLAIVGLCVFSNLNALATDNIAFAHNLGYSVDNLLVNNYALDPYWNSGITLNNTTLSESDAVVIAGDTSTCSVKVWGNNLYLADNQLRGSNMYFKYTLHDNTLIPSNRKYLTCAFGFVGSWSANGSTMHGYFFNNGNTVDMGTYGFTTSARHCAWQINSYTLYSGDYLKFNLNSSTINLAWFLMSNDSSFSGYVAPSYKYYGYDQGYQDGLLDNPLPDAEEVYENGYSAGYADGYRIGFDSGTGSLYTGTFSDYTIFSDYNTIGISNNSLNISDSSETLSSAVVYTNFTLNGYTINYQKIDIVGSDNYTGNYTLTLTGSTGYSGYKVSSFNIDENVLYKFMFNPDDTFNICISVPEGGGTYLYWTYALQTDGYINGVPYMDLTPYIKPWASHISCDIYIYNPIVRLLGADAQPLVFHNRTPIYGIVSNNLIIDNSNGNYNNGFDTGYLEGKNVGYIQGYEAHVTESGTSSFLGLFSAVIDAPVKVISDALDFELLGYNLKNFLFALLSIALVLFVIRLFV